MAKPSQHQQDTSASKRRGGGQAIVDLCRITSSGLVFWSRQRFEIGAELQIRIHHDALPCACQSTCSADEEGWVSVRGFVVECPAVRRPDGAPGFEVSLLLESALTAVAGGSNSEGRLRPATLKRMRVLFTGMADIGFN